MAECETIAGAHALPLPTALSGITAAWLSRALAVRFPGVEVTEASIADVMQGSSTKVWVKLGYNKRGHELGLPASLVVKGGFEDHSPLMAFMYENEARFYREVADKIEMHTPACYFSGTDREAGQSIVILEDLCQRNVTFCRAEKPLSFAQISRFLDAMARYHAQWWESPELADGGPYSFFLPHLQRIAQGGYRPRLLKPVMWEAETWSRFMSLPRCAAIPRALHDKERFRAGLHALSERHEVMPRTFSHGDTHLGNLFIEEDGTPGFFDAQLRRSNWSQDVTYHITAALDIADRRQWERALISYYLGRLAAYGAPAPQFDEAWLAYRCELLYGLWVWMVNENTYQTEATNTAVCARFGAAATDHDTLKLLLG